MGVRTRANAKAEAARALRRRELLKDQVRKSAEHDTDCYAYIRRTYGVPAKVGARIRYTSNGSDKIGTLMAMRTNQRCLSVKFDGQSPNSRYRLHPTWNSARQWWSPWPAGSP